MVLYKSNKRTELPRELDFLFDKKIFLNEHQVLGSVSGGLHSDPSLSKSESSSPKYHIPYMNSINAYIDAEWASDGVTICLQVLLHSSSSPSSYYIIINEKYRNFLSDKGYVEGTHLPFYDAVLLYSDFDVDNDNLTPLIQDYCSKYSLQTLPIADSIASESDDDDVSEDNIVRPKEKIEKSFVQKKQFCNLYLFYSPKDIWIAIGYKNFFEIANTLRRNGRPKIDQKRNISGSFSLVGLNNFLVQYSIKDVSGWTNQSLSDFAAGLNVEIKDKSLLDEFKSCMETGLEKKTDDFLLYALHDVALLKSVVEGQLDLINWVCKDILKLNKCFTQHNIPNTQGALLNEIFSNYLGSLLNKSARFKKLPNREALLNLAFSKLSLLDVNSRSYKKNLELHNKMFEKKRG